MTPAQFIARLLEPPVIHDALHLALFFADMIISLAIGGVVFLVTLIAGLRP